MARRKRSPAAIFHEPSPQQMVDMDMQSMARHLLMQDPLVKRREREIMTELKRGVTNAKKTERKKQNK